MTKFFMIIFISLVFLFSFCSTAVEDPINPSSSCFIGDSLILDSDNDGIINFYDIDYVYGDSFHFYGKIINYNTASYSDGWWHIQFYSYDPSVVYVICKIGNRIPIETYFSLDIGSFCIYDPDMQYFNKLAVFQYIRPIY